MSSRDWPLAPQSTYEREQVGIYLPLGQSGKSHGQARWGVPKPPGRAQLPRYTSQGDDDERQRGAPRSVFEQAYAVGGTAPWDIGRPQGDIVRLAEQGGFKGTVLDIGCGSGANALFLAEKGHTVVGIDAIPAAIERRRQPRLCGTCQPPSG